MTSLTSLNKRRSKEWYFLSLQQFFHRYNLFSASFDGFSHKDAGLTLLTGREGEEEDPSLVFLSQQQEVEAVTAKTLPHEVKSMLVQCTLNGNYDPVVAEEVTMDEAPWVQYQGLDSTQRIEESQSLDEAMVMEVEEEKEEEMEVEEQRNQWQEPAIIWSGFF
ncbi:uncharacterized protein [Typha angustifolia]|uniref:uncharacterized protein isoform X1 n=1 Tax=Typha angustifolia TaxID=59011 RepID=UPI003C2BF3CF